MTLESKKPRYHLVLITASLCLATAACGLQRQETPSARTGAVPTQLELSIGLKEDEWGRYTLGQLALIKNLQESDNLSGGERLARIAFIKKYLPQGLSF